MDLRIRIDGESFLLHDNAATIIYALRVLKTDDEIERVRFALDHKEQELKEAGQWNPDPELEAFRASLIAG